MSAAPTRTPFAFDTEFDASGQVVRTVEFKPVRRAYAPAEVDALVAQARLEAREAALAESDSLRAAALASIGQAVSTALSSLAQVAQAHREQAAEVALSAARVVAGAALERFPQGPLRSALEAMGQEVDASPRLVIRGAGLDEAGRAAVQQLCADAGFSGAVAFREEPGLPPAAFVLEWADGRAAFDPAEVQARIADAVKSALAAEAGHAEPLPADVLNADIPNEGYA